MQLKAIFPNPQHRLWPGVFVNVQLTTSTVANGLTVPTDAVQQGAHGEFLYTVGADGKAAVQQVRVGQRERGTALVTSGLKSGETVVVQGQYQLTEGTPVRSAAADQVANDTPANAGLLP